MDLVDSCNVTGYLITSEVCPPIPWKSRGSKLFDHEFQKSTLSRFCLRYSGLLLMAIGLYIRGAFAANARGCEHCLRGARASHSSGRIEGCYAGAFRGNPGGRMTASRIDAVPLPLASAGLSARAGVSVRPRPLPSSAASCERKRMAGRAAVVPPRKTARRLKGASEGCQNSRLSASMREGLQLYSVRASS